MAFVADKAQIFPKAEFQPDYREIPSSSVAIA
jgi:hypothetical protein